MTHTGYYTCLIQDRIRITWEAVFLKFYFLFYFFHERDGKTVKGRDRDIKTDRNTQQNLHTTIHTPAQSFSQIIHGKLGPTNLSMPQITTLTTVQSLTSIPSYPFLHVHQEDDSGRPERVHIGSWHFGSCLMSLRCR